MLTPWQLRSHRRFERNFHMLLDVAANQRNVTPNRWMSFERLSVYFRVSYRVLVPVKTVEEAMARRVRCIDIANVSTDERYQHQGMFTRLVDKVHASTDMPIYLENTQIEFANHLLANHGWKFHRDNGGYSYDLIHYRC